MNKPIVIAAGGTGGHVFPAIAIANELRQQKVPVVFIGVNGMEKTFIETENFPYHAIEFSSPKQFIDGFKLIKASIKAIFLLRRLRPKSVLAMGGYPCVPSGIAAWLCRIPLLIHEQNAIAGRANRLLSKMATRILTGFPNTFLNGIHTGNPVRKAFTDTKVKKATANIDNQTLRLLIVGGSQGAKKLNETLPAAVSMLIQQGKKIHVTHQTGKNNQHDVKKAYNEQNIDEQVATIIPFIDNMADSMQQADLVICRAGAATLAEISNIGAAALFVPFPHAAADHQTANAKYFSQQKAALLLPESQLSAEALVKILCDLNKQELDRMRQKIKSLSIPNAAYVVMNHCLEL